jgi:hypothetical protein
MPWQAELEKRGGLFVDRGVHVDNSRRNLASVSDPYRASFFPIWDNSLYRVGRKEVGTDESVV